MLHDRVEAFGTLLAQIGGLARKDLLVGRLTHVLPHGELGRVLAGECQKHLPRDEALGPLVHMPVDLEAEGPVAFGDDEARLVLSAQIGRPVEIDLLEVIGAEPLDDDVFIGRIGACGFEKLPARRDWIGKGHIPKAEGSITDSNHERAGMVVRGLRLLH